MPAVSLRGVSKKYRIFQSGTDRLKEALSFGRREYGHDFWALKDIDLDVEPGTTLGILGRNGAGKSTLLSIISGILQPTGGTVEVNGRLIALFALGAGFNPEFTGRDNVLLNGLILGIERHEMLERFDDIAAFADIGDFMDQPVKTYSSGMRSRLGFAVAINVDPDILVLDEVLATGDAVFKQAALQKVYELRNSGTTILFVSHSTKSVEDFCTEAIMLHEGRLMASGGTTEVIEEYQALVASIREQRKQRRRGGGQEKAVVPEDSAEIVGNSTQPRASGGKKRRKKRQQAGDGRSVDKGMDSAKEASEGPDFKEDPDFERRVAHLRDGTGKARIRGVELLDERLRPVEVVASGSAVTVRVYLEYLEAVKDSELVIEVDDEAGSEESRGNESEGLNLDHLLESQFYGPNLGYVLELYESYKEDPGSVDERTREFFAAPSTPQVEANGHAPAGGLFPESKILKMVPIEEMKERMVVDFTFDVPLPKGRYSMSVGVRAGDESSYLEKINAATSFRVKRPQDRGQAPQPTQIKIHTPKG
ncbi:MAG: ATP-binding cassette domain-containing protein [Actinomycetota bacterium]|nr:ATP-binding cassette domain-containing protein [Actinomycetota bacterium]